MSINISNKQLWTDFRINKKKHLFYIIPQKKIGRVKEKEKLIDVFRAHRQKKEKSKKKENSQKKRRIFFADDAF